MHLILDNIKCICSNNFLSLPKEVINLDLNEEANLNIVCPYCKSTLEVTLKWNKHEIKKTIAQKLNNQEVESTKIEGSVNYNSSTGIFTFDDMSQAKHLTRFEEVPAFLTKSLSTSTKKQVKYWKAL